MNGIMNNIEKWCKTQKCPNYVEWEYYGKKLKSCKLAGQTDNIKTIHKNCLFKNKENK